MSLMRWWFTTIVAVMARSLMQNSNTVFVVVFSWSHEHAFVMRLPNF